MQVMSAHCGLSEAAQRAGLSANQVRNYLHFRLLRASARNARGHYRFDQAAVNRLRLIGLATRAGLHLNVLRGFLVALDDPDPSALTAAREMVETGIRERRRTLRQLVQDVNRACESPDEYGAIAVATQVQDPI